MLWEGYVVLCSLFLGLCFLISDKVGAELIFLLQLLFFWNLNIVNSEEALAGFSNKGLVAIAALYILVFPLSSNEYLNILFDKLLKNQNFKISQIKVCTIVAVLSAFLNNTPLIQLLTPIIRRYSRINHFPSSRFLMPISFASIIGGMLTLIGTSTNIIIVSLLPKQDIIGFFDIAILSGPLFMVFLIYNYFFNNILPIRSGLFREIKDKYFVNVKPKLNKSVDELLEDFCITLEDIVGLYKDGNIVVERIQKLEKNNCICLKVNPKNIENILHKSDYEIMDCPVESIQKNCNIFYEVVVGNIVDMGKDIFEKKYNCHILAGRQMTNQVHKGSTLLILTNNQFYDVWHNTNDFYMISLFNQEKMNRHKLPIAIFAIVIIITASGLYSIEKSAMTGVAFLFLLKIITIKEALKIVNYNLLLTIGCSFGIAKAMNNSGISENIADMITKIGGDSFTIFVITQIITQILTELISNNAVAALMTQIVIDICEINDMPLKGFVIGLMISCNSSFITPYGYATNLIIQGSGGYKFVDYIKYGLTVKILAFSLSLVAYFL